MSLVFSLCSRRTLKCLSAFQNFVQAQYVQNPKFLVSPENSNYLRGALGVLSMSMKSILGICLDLHDHEY